MNISAFKVDEIYVGPRHREVNEAEVGRIAESIRAIGLQSPPAVRIVDKVEIEGEDVYGVPVLIYGLHRLRAVQSLGRSTIDCNLLDVDDDEAEMIEIAENLHRSDLTKDERYAQVRRYAELLEKKRSLQSPQVGEVEGDGGGDKPAQLGRVSEGGRGNKGIAQRVAEDTGLGVSTVKRILNPEAAELERERQRENRERAKLVDAASDAASGAIADAKKTNEAIAFRDADDFANWLMARVDLAELPTLISWLEGTKPKQTIAALRRIAA